MSLREEESEREKGNCPSRGLGLGLAAAAIGVGVGAALYYFVNKRTENPTPSGSTTQGWTCESPQTLHEDNQHVSDDSYTTVSEHSTTDTSICEDPLQLHFNIDYCESETFDSESNYSNNQSYSRSSINITSCSSDDDSDDYVSESDVVTDSDEDNDRTDPLTSSSETNDSDLNEWDVTTSLEYPSFEPALSRNFLHNYTRGLVTSFQKDKRNKDSNKRRSKLFRERSWSLEECSICFDVILRDQEIMSLPCTHHFHTKCILPWLQEQQTCPNCRKSVD